MSDETNIEKMEHLWIDCDCHVPEHAIRATYDPVDNAIWLEYFLERGSFWERLKTAFVYVFFVVPSPCGHYGESYLSSSGVKKLRDFLEKVREKSSEGA